MAQFNTSHSSVLDASHKPPQPKVCVQSIQERIAAFECNRSVAASSNRSSHRPQPILEGRITANIAQNVKPSSLRAAHSFKSPEIHRAPKLPERQKPNHIRIDGTQNEVQRKNTNPSVPKKTNLPNVFGLGNPPPKPNRPPSVDIHRFRRNIKSLKDGPGMRISHYATPPPMLPPLHLHPLYNHAAAFQKMDEDESCDDVSIMNPPPHPKELLSERTEVDLSEDMYEELDERWLEQTEKFKKHQESNNRKEVTEEKQAEPKGTINAKEMKRKDRKAQREEKKLLKQEKAKEKKKRDQDAKKKTIKRPIDIIKKGTVLTDFKGQKLDLPLTQGWLMNNESVNAEPEEEEEDIYDDIGEPEEVCSEVTAQNYQQNHVYSNVDNPDTRIFPLTQPSTVENDIYDDVDSQNSPQPFDGCDMYSDDIKEDYSYIYENVTM